MKIFQATTTDDLTEARKLFEEYAASLDVDLCFQNFAAELAGLPGAYAPPRGRLLLASLDGALAGCAAMRPHDEHTCEMKRLYVRPGRQGFGLGRELATRIITEARAIGYTTLLLDTLPRMQSALKLYESLGFVRREPYYPTPVGGSVFMQLRLGGRTEDAT